MNGAIFPTHKIWCTYLAAEIPNPPDLIQLDRDIVKLKC